MGALNRDYTVYYIIVTISNTEYNYEIESYENDDGDGNGDRK